MAIQNTSGQQLRIGDRVRMNIEVIGQGDLDGIAYTNDGKDYWRYMNQHPDEVYTITGLDLNYDESIYELSGPMAGNTWASDELILLPAPTSRFEVIKNMTFDEMTKQLLPMFLQLCKDGTPTPETFQQWLNTMD